MTRVASEICDFVASCVVFLFCFVFFKRRCVFFMVVSQVSTLWWQSSLLPNWREKSSAQISLKVWLAFFSPSLMNSHFSAYVFQDLWACFTIIFMLRKDLLWNCHKRDSLMPWLWRNDSLFVVHIQAEQSISSDWVILGGSSSTHMYMVWLLFLCVIHYPGILQYKSVVVVFLLFSKTVDRYKHVETTGTCAVFQFHVILIKLFGVWFGF